ncbi:hypothetical protein LCGC14_2455350 [marine sediment metagenome]|uniref:Uncharacterized protein n=1 Tax=marine sediment metagenome TaxID=412755 RepID=A0A0F9BET8_9ZZZZ
MYVSIIKNQKRQEKFAWTVEYLARMILEDSKCAPILVSSSEKESRKMIEQVRIRIEQIRRRHDYHREVSRGS